MKSDEGVAMASQVTVWLSGAAASDAQHLVSEYVAGGVEIEALDTDAEGRYRSAADIGIAAGVGFVVNATYDVASTVVRKWLASRGQAEDDVAISISEVNAAD